MYWSYRFCSLISEYVFYCFVVTIICYTIIKLHCMVVTVNYVMLSMYYRITSLSPHLVLLLLWYLLDTERLVQIRGGLGIDLRYHVRRYLWVSLCLGFRGF